MIGSMHIPSIVIRPGQPVPQPKAQIVAPQPGEAWPMPKAQIVAPRPGQPWPQPKAHETAPRAFQLSAAAGQQLAAASAQLAAAGVQQLAPVQPIAPVLPLFDFPGIRAGDSFDIAKGSKVGFLTPKGTADLSAFTSDGARFAIHAAAFGQKVDMDVLVERLDAMKVRITQTQAGKAPTMTEGRVVETRTNYSEFLGVDGTTRTVISHDGTGQLVIDTTIPTLGAAHLVLQKRA